MARRRKRIMGIPVGRSGPSTLSQVARAGAVGAAALAAVPAAQRGLKAAGRAQQLAGQASDAIGAAGQIKDAVSSHSSTVGKAAGLIGAVHNLGDGGKEGGETTPKLSHLIEENTEISVPRSVAYNQWTQMEMFPSLVKGVTAVDQMGEDRTEWISKIGPVKRRWKARILEQVPDERIVWKSESGPEHRGVVTFHSLDEELTRVLVQMHYVPHGPLETVANKLRIQRRRVRRDLRLFKHFLEMRGEETGAWRGSIGEDSADRRDPQAAEGRSRSAEASRGGGSGRGRASGNGRASGSGRTSGNGRSSGSRNGTSRRRAQTTRSKETAK